MRPRTLVFFFYALGAFLLGACTKNSSPKTIYDTVTVTKTDTVQLPPPDDTPNLTGGLILYLPFTNGSFADSSGLGSAVTAFGGAALGYDMHGYAQSAFNSAGNGAALLVANNGTDFFVDTAFSISFDFMIRSTPFYSGGGNFNGLQTLLSIVNFSNGNSPTFDVGFVDPSAPTSLAFDVNPSTNSCGTSGQNPNNIWDTTSFTPQLGAWYNVICIFTNGTGSVYINGTLVSSKTVSLSASVLSCPDAQFVVGSWWGGTESTNGEIDEVRMYNRSLTLKQIAWLARNFQINSNSQRPGFMTGKAATVN
ncbi:MAG TPA: LamG domain-containing protein [Puia sp.]|nr:LamG domain-containing protein [Puia sp.]